MAMNGMPPVARCDVTNCFFNRTNMCHAPAINVGSDHPACDAFIPENKHINRSETGLVGACHISDCQYNKDLICGAAGINVKEHAGHADCATFKKR